MATTDTGKAKKKPKTQGVAQPKKQGAARPKPDNKAATPSQFNLVPPDVPRRPAQRGGNHESWVTKRPDNPRSEGTDSWEPDQHAQKGVRNKKPPDPKKPKKR